MCAHVLVHKAVCVLSVAQIHTENEKLVSEIKELKQEIDQLQEDNAQLLQLAGEAEYFATMLKVRLLF